MSYTRIKTSTILPPQFAVKLDTGEFVLLTVATTRDSVNQVLSVRVTAAQVDTNGTPIKDAAGNPVSAEYSHSFILATCGLSIADCVKCCLLIMLEEPRAGIDPAAVAANGLDINITSDIRDAIAAAKQGALAATLI